MVDWTQVDFDNWYSPVKARVPIDHPEFGNSFPYGWNYFAYGSRRAINGNSEELGYLNSYNWVTNLVARNIYTPANKTLIVGCGIGAMIYRVLVDYSNASIWGADTSSYLHTIKDTNAPVGFDTSLIANIDITAPTAVNDVKALVGGSGKVGVLVCELATETIPVLDRPAWFVACEALLAQGGIVAHIVMSNNDNSAINPLWSEAQWTWQTIAEWGIEQPNHYFIDASDTDLAHVPA